MYVNLKPSILQSYKETMKFISGFEKLCQYKERVVNLRQHPSYKSFVSKWSLPIYFQIRLQEIAGSFEHQLLAPFSYNGDSTEEKRDYELPVSEMLELCLKRCWDDDVLLKPLTHRFYKLTLQVSVNNGE